MVRGSNLLAREAQKLMIYENFCDIASKIH